MASPAAPSPSSGISERVLVLLQNEHKLPIEPRVVIAASDGFVVAGRAGMSAWASKTSFDGKILWQYSFDGPKGETGAPRYAYASPKFNGAASMPDGSVWLVGSTYEGKSRLGLLVHIGSGGSVLSERVAQPSSAGMQLTSLNSLADCQPWGTGIVIAGSTQMRKSPPELHTDAAKPGPLPSPWNPAFWILIIDANGSPVYENVIPTGHDRTLGEANADVTLLVAGSDIVVSGKTGADTELLRLEINGPTRYQKHYADALLRFVRPTSADGELELLGSVLPAAGNDVARGGFETMLLSLDADLNELGRQTVPVSVVTNAAFRMADHSLVLFGAAVNRTGEQFTSQVTRIDPSLRSSQSLPLARQGLKDTGMIYAAAPYRTAGQFVLSTVAVVDGYPDHPMRWRDQPDFLRGAVLELISIQ